MGIMTISLDKPINILRLEELNPSQLQIVVVPKPHQRNFTKSNYSEFKCKEFKPKQIKLFFDFNDPLHVSHYGIDYIKVRVKNESLFVQNMTAESENNDRLLEGQDVEMKISVPRNYIMMTKIVK